MRGVTGYSLMPKKPHFERCRIGQFANPECMGLLENLGQRVRNDCGQLGVLKESRHARRLT